MENKNPYSQEKESGEKKTRFDFIRLITGIFGVPRKVVKFAILVMILILLFTLYRGITKNKPRQIDITSAATLEKIVKVNKLSTYTAVYNGVTEVRNRDNYEKIDYYVSYKAKVYLGIDFDKIAIEVDEEAKTIKFTIPPIHTTEVNVDISSLDFIFYNKKSNTLAVTQEAYAVCNEDARRECSNIPEISVLAKQNAINAIRALIKPMMEQSKLDYRLEFEVEEAK